MFSSGMNDIVHSYKKIGILSYRGCLDMFHVCRSRTGERTDCVARQRVPLIPFSVRPPSPNLCPEAYKERLRSTETTDANEAMGHHSVLFHKVISLGVTASHRSKSLVERRLSITNQPTNQPTFE
eukprot:sb/3475639/